MKGDCQDIDQVYLMFEDKCFICNEFGYSKPTASHVERAQWARAVREAIYEAFNIPVDSSFFDETRAELPICPPCSSEVGKMSMTQQMINQFSTTFTSVAHLQAVYDKIRAGIALSIIRLVAGTGDSRKYLTNLENQSTTTLSNSLRKSEVKCLQQLIFETWRDRTEEFETNFMERQHMLDNKVRKGNQLDKRPNTTS